MIEIDSSGLIEKYGQPDSFGQAFVVSTARPLEILQFWIHAAPHSNFEHPPID